MLRYNVNDDMTMWVGHESEGGDNLHMGALSVSGTYTGLPDMTMGFNVAHGSDGTNFQVGVDMDSCDSGAAMDNKMNMTLNHEQSFGDSVTMNNWFRLPMKQMMGSNMNGWSDMVAWGTDFKMTSD